MPIKKYTKIDSLDKIKNTKKLYKVEKYHTQKHYTNVYEESLRNDDSTFLIFENIKMEEFNVDLNK